MQVPAEVLFVCRTLQQAGHQAVVVGGAVRDSVLGRTPHDWDVATSALPDQMIALFPRVILTGLKHGTVTIVAGNQMIETTSFRAEGGYSDGRRPDYVKLGVRLEVDLSRRDFTINAMAYDPIADALIDPFGGSADARNRYIRAVGIPQQRFQEDGLRVMRAVRFAAVLQFTLDSETLAAIPSALDNLARVSVERVHDELLKLLAAQRPSIGLFPAYNSGILRTILPEVTDWPTATALVDRLSALPLARFGAILLFASDPRKVMSRWKLSNVEKQRLTNIIKYAEGWKYMPSPADIRRFISKVGREYLVDLYPFWPTEIVQQFGSILAEYPPLTISDLDITGDDVIRVLGVKGRQVGQALQEALQAVLENPAMNRRHHLLTWLSGRYASDA